MKALDRFIQNWRIAKAARYIGAGARVLDIGCADGAIYKRLPRIGDYVGVDPDAQEETLSPAGRIVRGMFPQVVEGMVPFDAITMLAVLEHVPASEYASLAEGCRRFLKPGGRLIVTVPSPFVDHLLAMLKAVRLIDGMSLEQHHGFKPGATAGIFTGDKLTLARRKRFQLGLNNLYVFEKS